MSSSLCLRSVLLLVATIGLTAQAAVAGPSPDPGTSSDRCGTCHRDIWKMWRGSAHADAASDPVFLSANRDALSLGGQSVSKVCLGCHAPVTSWNADWGLEKAITTEGVGCDVCHRIEQVEMEEGRPRIHYGPAAVKRGPIADAESPEHEVAHSALHQDALVCAGCHEYANAQGTPIMTTYSEWQSSQAQSRGQSCQDCHMNRVTADVVDPQVMRLPDTKVNLHAVPGGHSIEQLNRALGLGVDFERQADSLAVLIDLKNRGAGHAVPTGMPGRRVLLEVTLRTQQGKTFEARRIYTRAFLDANGATIERDSGFFAPGVKAGDDSRIRPDETRHEVFHFPVPPESSAQLTVRLRYEHAPTADQADWTMLTFASETRMVRAARRPEGAR